MQYTVCSRCTLQLHTDQIGAIGKLVQPRRPETMESRLVSPPLSHSMSLGYRALARTNRSIQRENPPRQFAMAQGARLT